MTSAVRLPRNDARPTRTQSASTANCGATSRKPSRRMRFARLRSTASWKLFFETTTPAWRPASGERRTHAAKRRPRNGRPRSKTLLYFAPESRVDMGRRRPLDLRQALATLGATVREYLTTALGRLAGTETDLARTFNLRGLPHHLHGSFSFLVKSE